jgi:Bacterial lectin/Secretion system C-terminal sorting domain
MNSHLRKYYFTLYLFVSTPLLLWSQPKFTLNGSAVLRENNCYQLTSARISNDVGAMWADFAIDLHNSLEVNFSINLGCNRASGEGIAFVIHNNKNGLATLGCGGEGMGFAKITNRCEGIDNSLAIEFDSRYTSSERDLYRPHLTLVQNGEISRPLVNPVALLSVGEILDCEYHAVKILWSPSRRELMVYIDENLRITYKGDLINDVFGGANDLYFGFTASSSAQAYSQNVCVESVIMELDPIFYKKNKFEQGVGIFTNPIQERLTIDIDFPQDDYIQIQLFDSSGKVIYEIPSHLVRENEYSFNLPGLPTGTYYVTVTNGSERVSKKITHISTMRA